MIFSGMCFTGIIIYSNLIIGVFVLLFNISYNLGCIYIRNDTIEVEFDDLFVGSGISYNIMVIYTITVYSGAYSVYFILLWLQFGNYTDVYCVGILERVDFNTLDQFTHLVVRNVIHLPDGI